MSIFAGRVFMCAVVLVTIVSVPLGLLGMREDWSSELVGGLLALATIGIVGVVAGLIVFPPFVETHINRHRIELRYVFSRRRVIPVGDVDEIVILNGLQLPGRFSSVTTPRVVLRSEGRVVAAYTPRRQFAVRREVTPLGIVPQADDTSMTPGQAHRRYPGSVTLVERAMRPAAFLAIVVGVGGLVWVLSELVS